MHRKKPLLLFLWSAWGFPRGFKYVSEKTWERNSALTSSKRQPTKGMFSCSTAKCNAVRPDFCSWALTLTPAAISCLRQAMLFAITTMWIALRPTQNKSHPSHVLIFEKYSNVRVMSFEVAASMRIVKWVRVAVVTWAEVTYFACLYTKR